MLLQDLLSLGECLAAGHEVLAQHRGIVGLGDLSAHPLTRVVDVAFNPLTSLRGLEAMPHLRSLSAYCCLLASLDGIEQCTRLEELFLQQNGVADLGFALASLRCLRQVRLDRNRLCRLPSLQSCSQLRFLGLSFNGLTSLEGLQGLQSLEELRVNGNRLTSLRSLRSLPSLRTLEAARNQLQSVDGVQALPSLESLQVDGNAITSLGTARSSFRGRLAQAVSRSSLGSEQKTAAQEERGLSLDELFLRENRLVTLDSLEALELGRLQVLDLRGNPLADREHVERVLVRCVALVELHCDLYPSTHIDDDSLGGLLRVCPSLVYVNGVKVSQASAGEGDIDEDSPSAEAIVVSPLPGSDLASDRALQEVLPADRVQELERRFRGLVLVSRSMTQGGVEDVPCEATSSPASDSVSAVFKAALLDALSSRADSAN